jgi:hypothetical protein
MRADMAILHDTSSLIKCVRNGQVFDPAEDKTTVISVIEFPKILSKEIGILFPKSTTYELAISLAKKLLQIGTPVKATDIIIAAIGIEKQLPLQSDDKHFELITHVDSRFTLISL